MVGIALAHLQETLAEIDPVSASFGHSASAWRSRAAASAYSPSSANTQRDQGFMRLRRDLSHTLKYRSRGGTVVVLQMQIAKRHRQIDVVGREHKPALQQLDRLLEACGLTEKATELDNRRRKRRTRRNRMLAIVRWPRRVSRRAQSQCIRVSNSGSLLRRADRCNTSIASAARFCARSTRPSSRAAAILPRFDSTLAQRAASPRRGAAFAGREPPARGCDRRSLPVRAVTVVL